VGWSIFKVVKAELDKADIEGLLALGGPGDEYSGEASGIENKVAKLTDYGRRELTPSDLTMIIESVWNEMFGPLDEKGLEARSAIFKSVAKEICKQVQNA
jgi:hypothetical protein